MDSNESIIRNWQERRLDRTILETYRDYIDLYDLFPNNQQPRQTPKEDPELQRQIEANGAIFEPLLVEPHPEKAGKFRIIDGDRRWTNSKILVEEQGKEKYRKIPVEVTKRTLTEEERLRVWIYIHRQRKEWDRKEKEMVANSLVGFVGRASASNILGITVRELDKLTDIYELAKKLENHLTEPGAAITWAREIKNLNKNLLTTGVLKTITERIKNKEITNSKDIRKLRKILKDSVAREKFLSGMSIDDALNIVLPPSPKKGQGLIGDIEELEASIKNYSWTALAELRGNIHFINKLEETERLLKNLRNSLADK